MDWSRIFEKLSEITPHIRDVLRLSDPADIEDTLQEALVRVYTRQVQEELFPSPKHGFWMIRLEGIGETPEEEYILAEIAAEAQRYTWRVRNRARRHPTLPLDMVPVSHDTRSALGDMLWTQSALQVVTVRQREALLLWAQGYSCTEVGERLGPISRVAAWGLVRRGLVRIRKWAAENEY